MQEAADATGARRFEQRERSAQIGLERRGRREDTAIHMRLGREVNDGVRLFFRQQRIHQLAVADIAMHEAVARISRDRLEVGQVAGIR